MEYGSLIKAELRQSGLLLHGGLRVTCLSAIIRLCCSSASPFMRATVGQWRPSTGSNSALCGELKNRAGRGRLIFHATAGAFLPPD